MRFLCIQHVAFEPPGHLARWVRDRGDDLHVLKIYEPHEIPLPGDFDALFILGGPMSVNDESKLPWLIHEKALVRDALKAAKPILGLCLGAQMIAQVVGAPVRPMGYREIGFFPITRLSANARRSKTFRDVPDSFTALHWHGEQFQIPDGALHLARSAACPHQAFEYGTALGLQFHLEMAPEYLSDMGTNCSTDLLPGGEHIQSLTAMQAALKDLGDQPYQLLAHILDRWVQ